MCLTGVSMKPIAMSAVLMAALATAQPSFADPNSSPFQPNAKTVALLAAFIKAAGRNAQASVVAPLRRPDLADPTPARVADAGDEDARPLRATQVRAR